MEFPVVIAIINVKQSKNKCMLLTDNVMYVCESDITYPTKKLVMKYNKSEWAIKPGEISTKDDVLII